MPKDGQEDPSGFSYLALVGLQKCDFKSPDMGNRSRTLLFK
ncbi:MAG: hypothetical protein JWQ35_184 [Bacteriovoracaceae bacterium]|nr:hypothetical protein [Bacteriovoracaceae bacterium]